MLPGLKMLAATVLLAVAIVIFAFGAAALLRAAHEDFAMLQAWRPAIDPLTDTFAPSETTPTLAALRIEPQQIAEPPPAKPAAAPAAPAEVAIAPAPAEIVIAPPLPPPPVTVVAALPAEPKIKLSETPYNAPRVGPRLMPEIATNDAPPIAVASLAPVEADAEPLLAAPLPRPKPVFARPTIRKRIVRRPPVRRVASRPAAQQPRQIPQTQNPFQQLFSSGSN